MAQDESTVRAVAHMVAMAIAASGTLLLACALAAELARRRRADSSVLVIVDRFLPSPSRRIAVGLVALLSSLASLSGPPSAGADTVRDWLTQPETTTTTAEPPARSDPSSPPTITRPVAPRPTRDWLASPSASVPPTPDRPAAASGTITPRARSSRSPRSQPRTRPAARATVGTVPARGVDPDPVPAPPPTVAVRPTPSLAEIVPPVTAVASTTYVVAPGDCLWDIAARALGADTHVVAIDRGWRAIYAANRDLIGADPNLIQPGLVLTLPTLHANA